jgi:hypothetical protein
MISNETKLSQKHYLKELSKEGERRKNESESGKVLQLLREYSSHRKIDFLPNQTAEETKLDESEKKEVWGRGGVCVCVCTDQGRPDALRCLHQQL